MTKLQPASHVDERIVTVRGHKVILDSDLAQVFGVITKRLNEQVSRSRKKFPPDFAFRPHRARVRAAEIIGRS